MEELSKYSSVEDLRKNLEIEQDATKENIEQRFKEVASNLLQNFIIRKTDTVYYQIVELECYFYNQNHKDIITYPRHASAGDWFFHASGVDLCFESPVEIDCETGKVKEGQEKQTYFGGILIRGLKKVENGKERNETFIMGPQNCCNELFNNFSALGELDDFPTIEFQPDQAIGFKTCGRYFHFNTTLINKLDSIKKYNWEISPEMDEATFTQYLKKEYCYFSSKGFDEYDKFIEKRKEDHEFYRNYPANPQKDYVRLKIRQ